MLDADARRYIKRVMAHGGSGAAPVATQRAMVDDNAARLFGPFDDVASVTDVYIPVEGGTIRGRIFRGTSGPRQPLLVYCHGGGWITGSLTTYEGVCRALAARSGSAVLSVDYRKAPEHQYPVALQDCEAALTWSHENADELDIDPANLAIGGDSAGGALAAVVARHWAASGRDPLRLQLLVYPVTECDVTSDSWKRLDGDYILTAEIMLAAYRHYLPGPEVADDPDASPLRATDLTGAPPAFVLTCEYDPLRDDGTRYAERLQSAGVQVELRDYPGLFHGAWRIPGEVPAAWNMLNDSAAALARAFNETEAVRR